MSSWATIPAFKNATWLNTPPACSADATGVLQATSGDRTDFWRITHYGFIRDDGHALLTPGPGDFTATLTFQGDYEQLYDQAGLMVRAGPENWVKFGVEYTDGVPHLSSVVTHGVSDWSARPAPQAMTNPITIRITRLGDCLLLQSLADDGTWQMERLAPWPDDIADTMAGPYLCSPERDGFVARFIDFRLGEPLVDQLHA